MAKRPTAFFRSNPLVGLVVYFVASIIFGIWSWSWILHLRSLPSEPLNLTIVQAIEMLAEKEELWVTLTDAEWHCGKLSESNSSSQDFPILDSNKQFLFVYLVTDKTPTCVDLARTKPSGIITRPNRFQYSSLVQARFPYIDQINRDNVWRFCGFCNSSHSKQNLWVVGSLFLLFLFGFVYHLALAVKH